MAVGRGGSDSFNIMAALVPAKGGQSHVEERKKLIEDLHKAVKQCQARFGGRTELATETDPRVAILCRCLECALAHGLRVRPLKNNSSALKQVTEIVSSSLNFSRDSNQHPSFWHYIREHLTRHEYERYQMLKQIWTDAGRGRAWLRSSLNENSLERYLHCLLGTPDLIANFYENWALLQDQECSSRLPTMARGLGSILFAISIDKVELNQPTGPESPGHLLEPVVGAPLPNRSLISNSEPIIGSSAHDTNSSSAPKERRRRRVPPKIISFDDDNMGRSNETKQGKFGSAPSTCMNSPVALSINADIGNTSSTLVAAPSTTSISSDSEAPSKAPTPPSVTVTHANEMPGEPGESRAKLKEAENNESTNVGVASTVSVSDQEDSPSVSPMTQAKSAHRRESRLPSPSSSTLSLSSSPAVQSHLQTLTPVNNISVGELIPVSLNEEAHSEEDSLSVPSYSEDTDCAAAALLATQRLLQNTSLDYTSPEQPSASVRAKSKVDLPSHVNGDVKEAVLSVLIRKEELQKENHTLRHSLEQANEEIATLRAELAENLRCHTEKNVRIESRLQALERENDLLKHQLRKYVGAVQMLRKDGAQAHEMLSQLAGGRVVTDGPDYHQEAREYEKKLIQVAEMHGELMEFNDRLQRALQAREAALRRLRDELIDLRGPLPEEPGTSDDDANSIASDYDGAGSGVGVAAARALVNIWVPSAFLTGGSSDVHHVYQVFIRIRDDEWNIYRRYAQFYALHKDLKKQDPVVGTFDFPPKKALGNKDARFVEERRKRLQHYLRCVMNHLVQTNAQLATSPDKDLLVHLVPFFGEMCNMNDDRSRRRRASSRNPFTRLTRVTPDPSSSASASPQYTGL